MAEKTHAAKHARQTTGEDVMIQFGRETVQAFRALYERVKNSQDFDDDTRALLATLASGKPVSVQRALTNLAAIGMDTEKGEMGDIFSSLINLGNNQWRVEVTEIKARVPISARTGRAR